MTPLTEDLATALTELQSLMPGLEGPQTPGDEELRARLQNIYQQLRHYTEISEYDGKAPLLAVVGGSTGAGKSTLVNTIIGQEVSPAGVIRPTTRDAVLVHHPEDTDWFMNHPSLVQLQSPLTTENGAERKSRPAKDSTQFGVGSTDPRAYIPLTADAPGEDSPASSEAVSLRMVATADIPRGLALMDVPDVDSINQQNRDLAATLLEIADLWIFVTTAIRYADAIPWRVLDAAINRRASVSLVLNRVPHTAMQDVRTDFSDMLIERGLSTLPVFAIAESPLDDAGLLPAREVTRIASWLETLARDHLARSVVALGTAHGGLKHVLEQLQSLRGDAHSRGKSLHQLAAMADLFFVRVFDALNHELRSGHLFSGEVQARWDILGQLAGILGETGWPQKRLGRKQQARLLSAAESLQASFIASVTTVTTARMLDAHIQSMRAWQETSRGQNLLEQVPQEMALPARSAEALQTSLASWKADILKKLTETTSDENTALPLEATAAIATVAAITPSDSKQGEAGNRAKLAVSAHKQAQAYLSAVYGPETAVEISGYCQESLLDVLSTVFEKSRESFLNLIDVVLADTPSAHVFTENLHNYDENTDISAEGETFRNHRHHAKDA